MKAEGTVCYLGARGAYGSSGLVLHVGEGGRVGSVLGPRGRSGLSDLAHPRHRSSVRAPSMLSARAGHTPPQGRLARPLPPRGGTFVVKQRRVTSACVRDLRAALTVRWRSKGATHLHWRFGSGDGPIRLLCLGGRASFLLRSGASPTPRLRYCATPRCRGDGCAGTSRRRTADRCA